MGFSVMKQSIIGFPRLWRRPYDHIIQWLQAVELLHRTLWSQKAKINPALQPNSSRTRSKTTKELKPMLFKPVQCQSCQTKCTQCCTFHLLRFCITTFWFWRNFGIMKFSASQRLTCQTKWLNAGLSILHVSALEIIM